MFLDGAILYHVNNLEKAKTIIEEALKYKMTLVCFAEEDVKIEEMLGNFSQTFVHAYL